MTDAPTQILSEHDAVEQIAETIQQADAGEAPFALVLGSGFSFGLVPTAREVVTESLPLWMKGLSERDNADETAEESFERQKRLPAEERRNIAIAFWKQFVDRNAGRQLQLGLGSHGLPLDYAAAYQSAFSPQYRGAVGEPMQARKFQRALMRLTQPRLNAAHFLLASILGVQPGKHRKSNLFKARAALSRLILTTNFDPFLQTALQSANRLYFMSDTPELGVTDEVFDDQTDAIHLVYVHGSIHRRSQIASEGDVKRLKEKNAQILAPVLKRHGVIVLGYSGWDDAIVEALVACDSFDHRLYWCGIEKDPFSKGAFGPCVPDIPRKPSACYVTTTGAGQFMAQLCTHLVHRLPRLLSNPIEQVREMLETIDLSELKNLEPIVQAAFADSALPSGGADRETFFEACSMTIQRLKETEDLFRVGRQSFCRVLLNDPESSRTRQRKKALEVSLSPQTEGQTRQLLSSAKLAEAFGNYAEALKLCEQALALPGIKAPDQGELRLLRGRAHYFLQHIDDAVNEWGQLIELPGASVEQIAKALNNRGLAWIRKGEVEKALADYAQVIDNLPEVPVEQVAVALRARGGVLLQANRIDEALSSYTRIIDGLISPSVEQVAKALINRGVAWGLKNESDNEIADYTRVIEELSDVPIDQVALALNNRGVALQLRNETDKALADYTRVIEALPRAPVAEMAKALNNRALTWSRKDQPDKAIKDYTAVIENLLHAPVEQIAIALNNRGINWNQKRESDKALSDYTRVIENLPGVPIEQVAKALTNRAVVWEVKNEPDKAQTDYTRVISHLDGAPVEQIAIALNNRGITWERRNQPDKALADYTSVIESLPAAPVEQVAIALNNRGVAWEAKGQPDKAMADYSRVIDHLPGVSVEQIAIALNNRGVAQQRRDQPDKAAADYTRIIDSFPDAPVKQVAVALGNRGWLHYRSGNLIAFLADTEKAVSNYPHLDFVAFNLGLALFANNRDVDGTEAYRRAAKQFPDKIIALGLQDLEEAKETELIPKERAELALQLLQSLVQP